MRVAVNGVRLYVEGAGLIPDDPVMPHPFGAQIAQHLPNARYNLLENAGQTVDSNAPQAFYSLMRDFINEVSDAA